MVAFEPGSTTRSASPGSARPGWTNATDDVRLGRQRVEIVEVGDARQPRHGDADRPPSRRRGCLAFEHHRVLRRQPSRRLEPGHDAEARQAGALAR